ncbi:MAG: hypothetical protein NTY35_06040 [Planctomycetota bacterium]|nr:hypothetical protein [Planctomycetota bacterium]
MAHSNGSTWRWTLIGGAVVLVLGLSVATLLRHDVLAPRGKEILWDDFGFALEDVSKVAEVGSAGEILRPAGQFVVVRLRTTNHAQRVDYDLASHVPILENAAGDHWAPDPAATSALRRELGVGAVSGIAAGEVDVSPFVFDLPLGVEPARVRITFGGEALQMLDLVLFGDRALAAELQR